jgi:hypothetical protein
MARHVEGGESVGLIAGGQRAEIETGDGQGTSPKNDRPKGRLMTGVLIHAACHRRQGTMHGTPDHLLKL